MMRNEQGYDLGITTFSPDGRIFQVEYAIEAIRHGTTAVGVKCPEGVVLVVEKRIYSLQDPESIEKVFDIDTHIGAAIAGLTADARVLVDHARVQAQINKLTYDEDVTVMQLTRKICDLKQFYTQTAGVRPFGVSLLIAGIDADGPQLFVSAPSGAYWSFKAHAIGGGDVKVREFFDQEYKPDLTLDTAILLALRAIKKVIESEKFDPTNIEIAVIRADTKTFTRLTSKEIQTHINKIPKEPEPKSE
ncbi:MAG: archaeal proteasome endopeptidase complex subunit alpha [Candidatus Helarchaeota archaeon]|nr:archaeal proteasome endopeptidase complex subunit alpha [Candidatus Helarchaeota archaeon]